MGKKEYRIRKMSAEVFNMASILERLGTSVSGEEDVSIFCPFHDDERGGHRSAKFYSDTRTVYCWSCGQVYYPYDALIILGVSHEEIIRKMIEKGVTDQVNFSKKRKGRNIFGKSCKSLGMLKKKFLKKSIDIFEYSQSVYTLLRREES